MASSDFLWTRLGPYVLTGNLHPSDLSLLVSENLIREQDAESILDSCASDVLETYKEAEKFAELVGNGRFTYEELEVMRAKGVLGDALVHYLVTRVRRVPLFGNLLFEMDWTECFGRRKSTETPGS